jgi:hypothetical protein
LLRETGEPLRAEVHSGEEKYATRPDGSFAISVPWAGWARGHAFSVPLEGTGLKSVDKVIKYDPYVREIAVGDIYVEREEESGEKDAEQ